MSVKQFVGDEISTKWWTFPGGERGVKILNQAALLKQTYCAIECHFRGSDDLIDIMLLANAIRSINPETRIHLTIPYFPYARQDRTMVDGESFSLQVAVTLIKSCNFNRIEIWDPHSDVLAGMFEPGILQIMPQWNLMEATVQKLWSQNAALVSPDAGALKKIYKLARLVNLPVVEASKVRDVTTGEITGTKIDIAGTLPHNDVDKLIVVDDICDGGRTFIELGKEIRKQGFTGELILLVTHGIFSKGRQVFADLFDQVIALNNMDKEI